MIKNSLRSCRQRDAFATTLGNSVAQNLLFYYFLNALIILWYRSLLQLKKQHNFLVSKKVGNSNELATFLLY